MCEQSTNIQFQHMPFLAKFYNPRKRVIEIESRYLGQNCMKNFMQYMKIKLDFNKYNKHISSVNAHLVWKVHSTKQVNFFCAIRYTYKIRTAKW